MKKRTITEEIEVNDLQRLLDWFDQQGDIDSSDVKLRSDCYCDCCAVTASYDRLETDAEQAERKAKEQSWEALRHAKRKAELAARQAIREKEELAEAQAICELHNLSSEKLRSTIEAHIGLLDDRRVAYESTGISDSIEGTRIKSEINRLIKDLDRLIGVAEKRGLAI